jgi:hypothetical protein
MFSLPRAKPSLKIQSLFAHHSHIIGKSSEPQINADERGLKRICWFPDRNPYLIEHQKKPLAISSIRVHPRLSAVSFKYCEQMHNAREIIPTC